MGRAGRPRTKLGRRGPDPRRPEGGGPWRAPLQGRKVGVREGLGGLVAPRAGCRVIVIPARVGAEGALFRCHLMESSCVERVGTHKGVKFE